ncbi:Acid phosphatase [Mycena kentingensis (nom. inval.)]|nr:Acid phosphatase [Mycena kentingensis (nom. inval.)]
MPPTASLHISRAHKPPSPVPMILCKTLLLFATALLRSQVQAATTVIPLTSFNNLTTFEQFWAYLYPWGRDHNGSARMVGNSSNHAHINVASSTLSLIATPTSGAVPPSSTADPFPAIHYASGAIHAKQQITVTASNSWTLQGEFSAPTARGTWPAFWLTAVNSWPPEAVITSYFTDASSFRTMAGMTHNVLGTANNWFNTFNTSSVVKSTIVSWPTDLSFHALKAVLTAEPDNVNVRIDFFLDNVLQATHFGARFVGAPLWLIINLQMEGSSGSPGPTGTTTYKVRNFQMTRSVLLVVAVSARFSFAQNTSTPLSLFPTPSIALYAFEPEEMPLSRSPPVATANEAAPYAYRPPQVPLDVKGYPVAPHGLQLEQVHVYVRHGERTPVGVRLAGWVPEHWVMCRTRRELRNPVMGAQSIAEALRSRRVVERKDGSTEEGLCLLGELTDLGRQSTFNYGAALRSLYVDRLGFLPDTLKTPGELYFRSTNMPRTIESLEQVIHGLYPTSKCSPDAMPTLLVRNGRDENLLGNTLSCKRLEYLQIGFAQAAASAYNHTLEPLDKHISKYLDGRPIRVDGKPRASGVMDTVRAAIAHSIKVPSELEDKSITDVIEQAVVNEWFADKTQEVRRLGMGPLLADLSQKLQRKAELGAGDPLKLLVHSTHDTALAAMCNTLDVFDEKWPAFTASITFELFKKPTPVAESSSYLQTVLSPFKSTAANSEFFVRMRYQNRNLALPICAEEGKHLPGSPEFCTLAAFRDRVRELTPVDWERECGTTGWA